MIPHGYNETYIGAMWGKPTDRGNSIVRSHEEESKRGWAKNKPSIAPWEGGMYGACCYVLRLNHYLTFRKTRSNDHSRMSGNSIKYTGIALKFTLESNISIKQSLQSLTVSH